VVAHFLVCTAAPQEAIENVPYGYAPAPVQSFAHAPGYYAVPAVDIDVGMGGHE
jgi:hypothetical protein